MVRRLRAIPLLLLLAAAPLTAQSVPTPREHFGFDIGENRKLADWKQLTAYYEKVAKASPRVKLDTIGTTTKGLPFVMLTITSEQNQAKLAELRDIQLRLADPRRISGPQELERLLQQGRNVVLITHSIHSTEVGGAQTAARVIYKLASSNDAQVREILDNVILLDVPSLNPDGTQWVNEWYMKYAGTDFDGTAPPWLYHFYTGHDNNRDWYAFTQKETQATVLKAHNAWHPEIVNDIHQMGGTGARMYMPPYIDPVEPNVDPAIIAAVNGLGTSMAAELTAEGKAGVVIDAIYDAWTPARAYQHYHGGVRILTETASARIATPINVKKESIRGGREYEASESSWKYPLPWWGGEWGLSNIVDYQEAGIWALLSHAAKNRRYWLENFYHINQRAVDGWPQWPAAWVIPADQANRAGLSFALRILTMADVEVHRATAPFSVTIDRGRTLLPAWPDSMKHSFPAGSYVIPMKQPYASFAETMLEVQHYPDLREFPGGPPKQPYNVTAHTLPLLMNFLAVPVQQFDGQAPPLSDAIPLQEWQFEAPAALRGRNAPRIGLYKSWQESQESGWTRWMFDVNQLGYDTIKDTRMRAGNLRKDYDVILLQSQSPGSIRNGNEEGSLPAEYTGGIGDEGTEALKQFVQQGGRLVAIEDATEFAIDLFGINVSSAVAGLRPQDFYVPGSIVRMTMDTTRALAAGVADTVYAWYWDASRSFNVRDPDVHVIARYGPDNPVVSGWILGPERLANRPALLEKTVGQGSVVLFGFQPNYRGHSVSTWPLLWNALTVPRKR